MNVMFKGVVMTIEQLNSLLATQMNWFDEMVENGIKCSFGYADTYHLLHVLVQEDIADAAQIKLYHAMS